MEEECNEDHRDDLPAGWRRLFDALLIDLERVQPGFRVKQATQKFGELRVYLTSGSPEAFRLIDEAEHKSRTICERCGEAGTLRTSSGYVETLCDEHAGPDTKKLAESPIVASFRVLGGEWIRRDREP